MGMLVLLPIVIPGAVFRDDGAIFVKTPIYNTILIIILHMLSPVFIWRIDDIFCQISIHPELEQSHEYMEQVGFSQLEDAAHY